MPHHISLMTLQNSWKSSLSSLFLSAYMIILETSPSLIFSPKQANMCLSSSKPMVLVCSSGRKQLNMRSHSSVEYSIRSSSRFRNSMNSSCSNSPPPSASISFIRSQASSSLISIWQALNIFMISLLETLPELSASNSMKMRRYSSLVRRLVLSRSTLLIENIYSNHHSFYVRVHTRAIDATLDIVVVEKDALGLWERGMGLVWIGLWGHVVGGRRRNGLVILVSLLVVGWILRRDILIVGIGVCVVDVLRGHLHLCIIVMISPLHIRFLVVIVPQPADGPFQAFQPLLDALAEDDCQDHCYQYIPYHLIISETEPTPILLSPIPLSVGADSEYGHLQWLLMESVTYWHHGYPGWPGR